MGEEAVLGWVPAGEPAEELRKALYHPDETAKPLLPPSKPNHQIPSSPGSQLPLKPLWEPLPGTISPLDVRPLVAVPAGTGCQPREAKQSSCTHSPREPRTWSEVGVWWYWCINKGFAMQTCST